MLLSNDLKCSWKITVIPVIILLNDWMEVFKEVFVKELLIDFQTLIQIRLFSYFRLELVEWVLISPQQTL